MDNQNVTENEEFRHKIRIIKLEKIDYKGNLHNCLIPKVLKEQQSRVWGAGRGRK